MRCLFSAVWSRLLSVLIAFWMGGSFAHGASLPQVQFFVAPTGDDAAPGTSSRPFARLEAARDALRALRRSGPLPAGGAVVWLNGGTYIRTNTFELERGDGGTADAPIEYRALPNQTVRLLGGRAVDGWQKVRDPKLLSRLGPEAREHVWQADVRPFGLPNLGPLRSRGFGRPIVPAHSELFYSGVPMTLARWPNEGAWERIAGFPARTAQGDEHGGQLGELQSGFFYAGDRPGRWKQTDQVWVHGYWAWDWANSYERVASLDLNEHLIRTAPPFGLYGFRKGQRFYFLNLLEELDEPGEWYLDPEQGQLFFWPPAVAGDANLSGAERSSAKASADAGVSGEAILSLLSGPFVALQDVSHVIFRGLTLEAGRAHGVSIRGGTSVLIAGCVLRDLGNYGVWIEGGRGHQVRSCDIEDTGDGGVNLSGGNRQTLEAGEQVVENCRFCRQGRWSKCYVPAVLVSGVGNKVRHNLIFDHPHCAILFSGNEHEIEFNEIHHVALETGDVGAIYAGRDWSFRGNAIRHNFVHDTGGVGMGSMGVYMDDCVSGTEISGNAFYRVSRAVFLGGGRDHQVRDNVLVDCKPAVQLDGRGLDHSPVWHNMVYDYMKQQLAAVPTELYRARYPALTNVDQFYRTTTNGIPPEGNVVAGNICVGGEWLSVGWHARENGITLNDNYVGADPGFNAPEGMDFRLKSSSPLLQRGFKQLPLEPVGVYADSDRGASGMVRMPSAQEQASPRH